MACKPSKKDTVVPTAGKGGSSFLRITPQHHGKNIDSATVYLKYNSSDASATYDDSAVCQAVGGLPVARFDSLKAGQYYIFSQGYDPSIFQAVKGGIPFTISASDTFNVLVPVTEGD